MAEGVERGHFLGRVGQSFNHNYFLKGGSTLMRNI